MEVLGTTTMISLAQGAMQVAILLGGYLAEVKSARHDIERLKIKVLAVRDVVDQLAKASDPSQLKTLGLSSNTKQSIEQCNSDLRQLQQKLESGKQQKGMRRFGMRALKWPFSRKEVDIEVKNMEGYLIIFNTSLQLDNIALSRRIDNKLDDAERGRLLEKLPYVGDAAYDSYENQRHRQCLSGTRVDLLQNIIDWANDASDQCIFWLKGSAGTGKSTVALTVAHSLHDQGKPVASFFFKRGEGDLASARKVITTITFQLATQSTPFCDLINKTVKENPALGQSASLAEQYDRLLVRPLREIKPQTTHSEAFIVVFDALDECDDSDSVRSLLRLLGSTKDMANLGLRIFVTSRPETPIRLGFQNMSRILHRDLALHELRRETIDHDIGTFIRYELEEIRRERRLPERWPGDEKIARLVTLADGLFIFASTACRYTNGPLQVSVARRLDQICQGTETKHHSTKPLDEMYLLVLQASIAGEFVDEEEEQATTLFRQVVGSIVLLFDSLPVSELGRLLLPAESKSRFMVSATLEPLHTFFYVPESAGTPVRILHLSFRDFLVNRERCPDPRFWVDERQVHHNLALECLDLMSRSLRENICQLPSPGTLVSEVPEREKARYVRPALQYACEYWLRHAKHAGMELCDDGFIHLFLQKHYLHWLEVMGLMGRVREAVSIIIELENGIIMSTALYALACDARRFVLRFGHVLTLAPLQVYSSGLVFSPRQSLIRQASENQGHSLPTITTQVPEEWDACLQTLEGHPNPVTSVTFSPNGFLVASSSGDRTIRLWDVRTGRCQHIFEGHLEVVRNVVFSPDGSLIASASDDKTVRIWDIQTEQCRNILQNHPHRADSLVFSPSGDFIASASCGKSVGDSGQYGVRIWDVKTGICQQTLGYHLKSLIEVVFSPNGSLVVSTSWDKTVRLFNMQTGQCVHTLQFYLQPMSAVFSPDSSLLASGSSDSMVRLWNVQTGQCQQTFEGHSNSATSVVFSLDGTLLASASSDQTVRLWNVQTGQCVYTLRGHTRSVSSVVVCPGGILLASAAADSTVRMWDMRTGQCQYILGGHTMTVTSVAFSPNGSLVASGSIDNTVRIWDIQTKQRQDKLECHAAAVEIILFSPDRSLVASASTLRHDAVRIWDAETGRCLHTLRNDSSRAKGMVFSPDGVILAVPSPFKGVRLWNVKTGNCQLIPTDGSEPLSCITISPTGLRLASGSHDTTIKVWELKTGRCECILQGHSKEVETLAFSPNGSLLALGSYDGTLRVWDLKTGECLHTLGDSAGKVRFVTFSPSGLLVASSGNRSLLLWDVRTGNCRASLKGHSTPVKTLKFSSDETLVASASSFVSTVRVWDIATSREILCHTTTTWLPSIEFTDDDAHVHVGNEIVPIRSTVPSGSTLEKGAIRTDHRNSMFDLEFHGEWLMCASQRMLWLPGEYRPSAFVQHGDSIVFGSSTGRVTFLQYNRMRPSSVENQKETATAPSRLLLPLR